jgi:hypothetical protein
LISLITIIAINNSALAQEAVYLDQNQKAPFSGILIPEDKLQELRKSVLDVSTQKEINLSLQRSVDLYKQNQTLLETKVNTLSDQNNKLSDSLYSARETSNIEKFGYFVAGALLTGLTSYGIYKAGIAR